MKHIRKLCVLLVLLFPVTVFAEENQTFTFGVVPQFEPQKLSNIWLPILKAVEKETGYKLRLVGSAKIPEFEKSFVAGEFDFAYMNPYHMIVAEQQQGYLPLVRDHGRKLFGVLVVKKDSPVTSPQELNGKTIAFPAPNALGASLLMRADLTDLIGIQFTPKYVQTHSSVYFHTSLGITDAGGGVKGTFNRQDAEVRGSLKIIYETRKMPPHPIAAHPRVPDEVRESITQAFLKLGMSEEGKKMLSLVPIKEIGTAVIEDYQVLSTWGLEKFYIRNNGK